MPAPKSSAARRGTTARSTRAADDRSNVSNVGGGAGAPGRSPIGRATGTQEASSPSLLLGQGQFFWMKDERKSMRWGAFYLEIPEADGSPYSDQALAALADRRVRLIAEIVACAPPPTRHVAAPYDFLGGRVGDVVELGVGMLRVEALDREIGVPGNRQIALETGRRRHQWMRSAAFWYLRAHTVAIRAERTADARGPSHAEIEADYRHLAVRRRGRVILQNTMPSDAHVRRMRARLPER